MSVYKLYHRTKGSFFHFDELDAGDDPEARRLAQALRGVHPALARVEGGRRASARQSGFKSGGTT